MIYMDGVPKSEKELINNGITVIDEEWYPILSAWLRADEEHNFQSYRDKSCWWHLSLALERASQMRRGELPELFKVENLKFITKEKNRMATLYFSISNADKVTQTGRLRQTHKGGPFACVDKHVKTRISFSDKTIRRDFTGPFVSPENSNIRDGEYLLEYYLKDGEPKGKHPSGGTIDTKITEYNDDLVQKIYKKIIGERL